RTTIRRRAHGADRFVAGKDRRSDFRRRPIEQHTHGACPRGAAMLHPRHNFLADITALVEIDTGEAVHIGFVREGIAIDEVETAAGRAYSNAVRLIGGAVDQLGTDQIGGLPREFGGNENAKAEIGVTWIGEGEIWLQCDIAIPYGEYAEAVGKVFDSDVGAQPVERELVGESLREHFRAIDQKAAAMTGRRLGDQEIYDDFTLRRQQRAETPQSRLQPRDICGDEAVEKVTGGFACDLDH